MSTAVLVIDMIKDFVTGKFENERAQAIVPNIEELLDSARASDKPVIYVSDSHSEEDREFSIWGDHAIAGSEGTEIVPELEPEEGDHTLKKDKYSAFYDTELDSLLEELDIDRIVLTGVLTHICIQHTAADAFYRGYDIVIPVGCVEDLSDEENETSLDFIEENYGAEVIEFEDLKDRWEQ